MVMEGGIVRLEVILRSSCTYIKLFIPFLMGKKKNFFHQSTKFKASEHSDLIQSIF